MTQVPLLRKGSHLSTSPPSGFAGSAREISSMQRTEERRRKRVEEQDEPLTAGEPKSRRRVQQSDMQPAAAPLPNRPVPAPTEAEAEGSAGEAGGRGEGPPAPAMGRSRHVTMCGGTAATSVLRHRQYCGGSYTL